jgi:hypothetical protein
LRIQSRSRESRGQAKARPEQEQIDARKEQKRRNKGHYLKRRVTKVVEHAFAGKQVDKQVVRQAVSRVLREMKRGTLPAHNAS